MTDAAADLSVQRLLRERLSRLVLSDFESIRSILLNFEEGDVTDLQLLLSAEALAQVEDAFPLNAYLQQLDDGPSIDCRVVDETELPTLAVGESSVFQLFRFGGLTTWAPVDEASFRSDVIEEFDALFERGAPTGIDVPAWDDLLADLRDATSEETAAEFRTLIESRERQKLDEIDEVTVALIAAARTGALQYDVSKWGEEANVGSRATFSRRKTKLEDSGTITTESVPVEVGRPRDRLLLNIDAEQPDEDASGDSSDETGSDEQGSGTGSSASSGRSDEINRQLRSLLPPEDE